MNISYYLNHKKYPIVVLGAAFMFFCYDIIKDIHEGDPDVLIEGIIMLMISHTLYRELVFKRILQQDFQDQYNQNLSLSGELSKVISRQLDQWKLTHSEKEISWMIIKGYPFSEIAELRNVKEKTIRFHAASIYSKSNTANRSEFAAFFIEDLINVIPQDTGHMPS